MENNPLRGLFEVSSPRPEPQVSPQPIAPTENIGYETDFICLNFSTKYRSFQGLRSSSVGMGMSSGYSGMVGKTNNQSKVEAKYPALLFKQHLAACIEKLFGMIRDNLKKEISPFLHLCIQVKTKILLLKKEKK